MTCTHCFKDIEPDSTFCRFCGASSGLPPRPQRRLVRLPGEGKVAGVCAGIAAYFDADVTLVRLAWVILSIVPGALVGGLVAYIAAWLLLPEDLSAEPHRSAGKRLFRSVTDHKIAGVCGGIAHYLDVDATIVRLGFVVLAVYPGAVVCGVIAYLIGWAVIPKEPASPLEPLTSPA